MRIREIFERFEPYGWETPSWEIAERVGLSPQDIVRLDTNTSPHPPSPELAELARTIADAPVNDYPDTSYLQLREGLSRYTGKGLDRFVVTNGADEGLDIVSKVFLDPGDEVIVLTPTYSMYRIAAETMGARVIAVERRGQDFGVDVDRVLASVTERTRLIFLCNPNNPTANLTPSKDVENIVRESDVGILVDEAYYEFCGQTAIDLTDKFENVIVCRSFSKGFSMAGVRIGYLVAHPATVDKLNAVRPPNSLTVPSLMLGHYALAHTERVKARVRASLEERGRLFERLKSLDGIVPYPTQTNFILFRVEGRSADELHEGLMRKGLVLRNLSHVRGVENCLRTTVSTDSINDRLVESIRGLMRAHT